LKQLYLIILLNIPLLSDALFDTLNKKLHGKSFVSVGVVQQISNNFRNAQALNLNYSFLHRKKFGIDISYTQSLSEAENRTKKITRDFSSISILPTYLIVLDNNVGVKVKAGYAKNKNLADGFSYGAEIIFQITQNMGLGMTYQQMNRDMKYLMINSIYRLKH